MNLSLAAIALGALLAAQGQSQSSQSRARAPSGGAQSMQVLPACAASIRDQANPSQCLQASSVPSPGLLFPPPHDGGVNNVASGTNSFIGGGQDNQATNGLWGEGHSTVCGGRRNVASDDYSAIGGGIDNSASAVFSTIGGGWGNSASGVYATIAGGEANEAYGEAGAVGGGEANSALGVHSTVSGGSLNSASGQGSSVAGGRANTASGFFATVSGGSAGTDHFGNYQGNTASGDYATVGGGHWNAASGHYSSIPGGSRNVAGGDYSLSAGRRAKANHAGAFVWGDGQNVDKPSSAADEFNVYASGGVRMFSNSGATAGVLLAPGGGSWSSVSDRASKENVEPVDAEDVLERVCGLPITTWNYEAQDDSIRHMGPMAQDFHAAFGLGVNDKTIDTIDPDGVALAAIQGLNERVNQLLAARDAEIAELRAVNAALATRVERLESGTRSPTSSALGR